VFVIELICGSCSTIGREVGVFTLHREFVWTEMSKCAPMGGVWCCFDFLETQKYIEMYAWAKEEKGRRPIWLGWLCPRIDIILSKHGHFFFFSFVHYYLPLKSFKWSYLKNLTNINRRKKTLIILCMSYDLLMVFINMNTREFC
jgi:hypothetical protein